MVRVAPIVLCYVYVLMAIENCTDALKIFSKGPPGKKNSGNKGGNAKAAKPMEATQIPNQTVVQDTQPTQPYAAVIPNGYGFWEGLADATTAVGLGDNQQSEEPEIIQCHGTQCVYKHRPDPFADRNFGTGHLQNIGGYA